VSGLTARNELGYFGPTYMAAKAATMAPRFFVRGIPCNETEARAAITPTKINVALDVITHYLRSDKRNRVKLDKQWKFVIHTDSREVVPMILYACDTASSIGTSTD
jgi:hypothetical protein